MKRIIYPVLFLTVVIFLVAGKGIVSAENIDPDNDDSQFAWGENVGWLNLEPDGDNGPGVVVTDSVLTGYMWGENVGWIKLNPENGGVVNDGLGNLSGYAWGENVGWINFSPAGGGVTINPATGVFSGFAWGENVGWINFAPAGRKIKTSWRVPVSVTVQTSPTGMNYTVDGILYTSPKTFQWTPGSSHTIATTSPQGSGTRYVFTNWSDGGAISHTVTASASPTTYTATFDSQYLLTTSVSPSGAGTISADPTSADGYYNSGTPVQLTATANAGYQYANWSGDLTGTINPQSLTMSAPRSVTANFNYTLTYIFDGFFSPVDNPPVVNTAKAGQTIPVKWRITDTNGIPTSDPASFMSLTSYRINCDNLSEELTSPVEESAAGSSGLQYSGDGYWQFNWKTPKTYAGQCRTMVLTLGDGSTHSANFKFK